MLIVRSTPLDLTTQARIRQAAIERFPRDGTRTTIRAVATDAGVSPALVLHHFGSKEGLIRACDQHVVETIRSVKGEAIGEGTMSDPGFLAGAFRIAPPIMRYLGWALAQGTPTAGELFDEMVEESVRLLGMAEEQGMVKPTDHPHERSAVLLTMQLGAIVLHDHLVRSAGIDVFEVDGLLALSRASMEIFGGLFEDATATQTAAALNEAVADLRKETDHG